MRAGFVEEVAPNEVRIADDARGSVPAHVALPIVYRDAEVLTAFFLVDARRAADVLPAGLHPVRALPRRAVMVLAAFDYKDTSVGTYGEVCVGVLASRREMPVALGVLGEKRLDDVAIFVQHLPVTTAIALAAGRALWGYPKFLADIRFRDDGAWRVCDLSEDGVPILSLSVRRDGARREETRAFRTWTVRDGKLLHTTIRAQLDAHVRHGRSAARLELGPHAIGREVASWRPSSWALEARHVTHMQSILPAADWAVPLGAA